MKLKFKRHSSAIPNSFILTGNNNQKLVIIKHNLWKFSLYNTEKEKIGELLPFVTKLTNGYDLILFPKHITGPKHIKICFSITTLSYFISDIFYSCEMVEPHREWEISYNNILAATLRKNEDNSYDIIDGYHSGHNMLYIIGICLAICNLELSLNAKK